MAFRETAEVESRELLMKLHAAQLQLHSTTGTSQDQPDSDNIRLRLVSLADLGNDSIIKR